MSRSSMGVGRHCRKGSENAEVLARFFDFPFAYPALFKPGFHGRLSPYTWTAFLYATLYTWPCAMVGGTNFANGTAGPFGTSSASSQSFCKVNAFIAIRRPITSPEVLVAIPVSTGTEAQRIPSRLSFAEIDKNPPG